MAAAPREPDLCRADRAGAAMGQKAAVQATPEHLNGMRQRHCIPVRVSVFALLSQFGRTSVPMIPQLVQTMPARKAGTGIVSMNASTFMTAAW
jgi:hypothetical protein